MKSLSDLWDSILARLSGELSDMTIKTWFDEITVVTMEDSALVLHCSNPFKKNTVEARFLPHIKAALKDIFSTDLEVKILSDEQLAAYHGVAPDRPGNLFDSDAFTFETYVVGPQNKLAYAAAKAVAEKPAEGFNPLFIYGESGLGKTHLLYAIAHLMRSRRPESRIVYIKGDDFTNELVSSIRENRNAEFREKYRQADILLVDDIQFIAGKIQTQEEFFHTFETLHQNGKQIILTSDRPPKEIKTLEDRLKTRFEWGLLADIQPPDFETRLAILRRKVTQENLDVSDEVLGLVAERVYSNIRDLEGSLNRVLAYAKFINKPITASLAENVLKDYVSGSKQRTVTPELIRRVVCDFYSVSPAEMEAGRRERRIAYPRQIAMYLTRILTESSFPEIGAFYGGRHYSTVMYACEQIEKSIETDAKLKKTVDDLTEKIMNG